MSIDIVDRPGRPAHERIRYILGSSIEHGVVELVADEVSRASCVMVILDSDHYARHVLEELELYSPFVTLGSYLVVEDTNVNRHPVWRDFGPGPMEAVDAFLKVTTDFSVDRSREKFHFTFNPKGYLKRTASADTGA